MKNVIDWLKLVVMVVMGLVWIVISDYSEFAQILGMFGFICSAFVWVTSDQANRIIKSLID